MVLIRYPEVKYAFINKRFHHMMCVFLWNYGLGWNPMRGQLTLAAIYYVGPFTKPYDKKVPTMTAHWTAKSDIVETQRLSGHKQVVQNN